MPEFARFADQSKQGVDHRAHGKLIRSVLLSSSPGTVAPCSVSTPRVRSPWQMLFLKCPMVVHIHWDRIGTPALYPLEPEPLVKANGFWFRVHGDNSAPDIFRYHYCKRQDFMKHPRTNTVSLMFFRCCQPGNFDCRIFPIRISTPSVLWIYLFYVDAIGHKGEKPYNLRIDICEGG